jgi:hypothetical protein
LGEKSMTMGEPNLWTSKNKKTTTTRKKRMILFKEEKKHLGFLIFKSHVFLISCLFEDLKSCENVI